VQKDAIAIKEFNIIAVFYLFGFEIVFSNINEEAKNKEGEI
jgi:hypothetical protein